MNITRQLAENVVKSAMEPLTDDVALMAQQTLLNVLATAIGASMDEAVRIVTDYGRRFGGPRTVPVPGANVSLDPLRAATAIGLAAHLDDFDDTHLATVIHPGAANLAAALATGIPAGVSGGQFLTAYALGCEVALRLGVTMSPWHYEQGWHITGTCAPVGAAVTATLLGGGEPDVDTMERAIAIAADMALGNRESFGSMIKAFHPGKGAANGVLAAAFAARGVAGPDDTLGRSGGYFEVLSPRHEPELLNESFGLRWELLRNTFKPYPCGIVCHPAIDAAVGLASRLEGRLDLVEAIAVYCHPLVAELTGNPQPTTGLQAKFSTIHGVAAGLCDGQVALPQYADERVIRPDVTRLRDLATLVVEPDRARDSARVTVTMRDGAVLTEDVPHARGSLARPLTEAELHEKARRLIEPVMPGAATALIAQVAGLTDTPHLEGLVRTLQPSSQPVNRSEENA